MSQLPAILVVDDQQHNLVAMEAIFDGEPVDLVMATSGQEALVYSCSASSLWYC